jgi:hypothetical protein
MAVVKSVQMTVTLSNGGASGGLAVNISDTGTGDGFVSQLQKILASGWNAIGIGNCASADLVAIKNLDAANYIEVALDNAGANKIAKLTGKAGGKGRFLFLPLPAGTTLYAKANTADCLAMVAVCEP